MSMEVWPAKAGEIAGSIGTIVTEEKYSVADNFFVCVSDANIRVRARDVSVRILLE
jgi:hypothetical protein